MHFFRTMCPFIPVHRWITMWKESWCNPTFSTLRSLFCSVLSMCTYAHVHWWNSKKMNVRNWALWQIVCVPNLNNIQKWKAEQWIPMQHFYFGNKIFGSLLWREFGDICRHTAQESTGICSFAIFCYLEDLFLSLLLGLFVFTVPGRRIVWEQWGEPCIQELLDFVGRYHNTPGF